ncbi:hypothetical protein SAY87_003007 [Trapa incisa]|uniref:Uncharacterized protein n=1 Tax=Trapa incisa TaxID=236973 RepID=A0AAN7QH39_9MYRT|nr:hypothetical protein SAY87_003007 [Trapa incisa]
MEEGVPRYSLGERTCFSPMVRQVPSFSLFRTQSRHKFQRPTVHSYGFPPNAHANENSVGNRELNEEAPKISGVTESLDGNSCRSAHPPPCVPSDSRFDNVRDNYNPRFQSNAMYPPQSTSPYSLFRPQGGAYRKPIRDPNSNFALQEKLINPTSMEVNPKPYFPSQASSVEKKLNERIAMEARMFQVQSKIGAMSAHRNVATTVQNG